MLFLEQRPIEGGVGGHLLEFRARRPGSPQSPVLHGNRAPGQEGNWSSLAVIVWQRGLEGLGLLVEVVQPLLRLLTLLLRLVLLEERCPRAAV